MVTSPSHEGQGAFFANQPAVSFGIVEEIEGAYFRALPAETKDVFKPPTELEMLESRLEILKLFAKENSSIGFANGGEQGPVRDEIEQRLASRNPTADLDAMLDNSQRGRKYIIEDQKEAHARSIGIRTIRDEKGTVYAPDNEDEGRRDHEFILCRMQFATPERAPAREAETKRVKLQIKQLRIGQTAVAKS